MARRRSLRRRRRRRPDGVRAHTTFHSLHGGGEGRRGAERGSEAKGRRRLKNGSANGTGRTRERAVIGALRLPSQRRWEVEDSLDELAGLAEAAGATVVHRVMQDRPAPTPGLYF